MNRVGVHIRLRPIRFAFLVRPNDKRSIQRIFEINTCLWGGIYNPIIPYFERTPDWWSRDRRPFYKPREIINGYLNFFEPDFFVEAEKGLAQKLDLPEEIVIGLNQFRLDESAPGYKEIRGLSTYGIYRDLYQKEYRFVRRHEHKTILAKPGNVKFRAFSACVFGCFPEKKALEYLARGYRDAFTPEQIVLGPGPLEKMYRSPCISPLDIGCENFEVFYSDRMDPMLFVLDAFKARDLVDFWNLRAYKRKILAIPVQWLDELSRFCQDFVVRNHRPLPGNVHGVMIDTTVCFSRSLSKDVIKSIRPAFYVKKKGAVVFQDFYPSIWEKTSDMVWRPNRPALTAKEGGHEAVAEAEGRFRFDTFDPDFVDRFGSGCNWANVVNLGDPENRNEIATVFPSSLRNPSFPNLSFDNKRILSNTEGLVVYPDHKNWHEYWTAVDGTSAFIKWFETHGRKATISPAGKTLLQVMRSLEGFWGVRDISHPTIVSRLNAMACKLSRLTEETRDGQQKEYFGRTVRHSDLKKEIYEISEKDDVALSYWKQRVLESLVKYSVIKLGLEVKCDECDHRNWYSIDSLKYELVCEDCLKSFAFPQDDPSNHKVNWCYRVIGPFAKPDYAQGAYASALALRFFGALDGTPGNCLTWSTSLELTLKSGDRAEADFLLWYQRQRVIENNYATELVFGESKSYAIDSFKDADVRNLRHLALEFPGSILVCATLKDKLDAEEKARISRLALWGRETTPVGTTRAPVIVLTGTELFSSSGLGFRYLWREKGGKRAQLVEPAYVWTNNPRVLADLTQQVYLGLPSYGKWWKDRWDRRKRRRRKSEGS